MSDRLIVAGIVCVVLLMVVPILGTCIQDAVQHHDDVQLEIAKLRCNK